MDVDLAIILANAAVWPLAKPSFAFGAIVAGQHDGDIITIVSEPLGHTDQKALRRCIMRVQGRLSAKVCRVFPDDTKLLEFWGEKLRPIWGDDALEQLRRAEFLVGVFEHEVPVGFGGITTHGNPEGDDAADVWLDFLFVVEGQRGRGLLRQLYGACMEYADSRPTGRRLLAAPIHRKVWSLLVRDGWTKLRDVSDDVHMYGVYERPRKAL